MYFRTKYVFTSFHILLSISSPEILNTIIDQSMNKIIKCFLAVITDNRIGGGGKKKWALRNGVFISVSFQKVLGN